MHWFFNENKYWQNNKFIVLFQICRLPLAGTVFSVLTQQTRIFTPFSSTYLDNELSYNSWSQAKQRKICFYNTKLNSMRYVLFFIKLVKFLLFEQKWISFYQMIQMLLFNLYPNIYNLWLNEPIFFINFKDEKWCKTVDSIKIYNNLVKR